MRETILTFRMTEDQYKWNLWALRCMATRLKNDDRAWHAQDLEMLAQQMESQAKYDNVKEA